MIPVRSGSLGGESFEIKFCSTGTKSHSNRPPAPRVSFCSITRPDHWGMMLGRYAPLGRPRPSARASWLRDQGRPPPAPMPHGLLLLPARQFAACAGSVHPRLSTGLNLSLDPCVHRPVYARRAKLGPAPFSRFSHRSEGERPFRPTRHVATPICGSRAPNQIPPTALARSHRASLARPRARGWRCPTISRPSFRDVLADRRFWSQWNPAVSTWSFFPPAALTDTPVFQDPWPPP